MGHVFTDLNVSLDDALMSQNSADQQALKETTILCFCKISNGL